MRKVGWRNVAYGLAAATLGLTFAACGDDTVSPDASVSPDLSGSVSDMTKGPVADGGSADLLPLPTAQAVIADVVGSVWAPLPDMGEREVKLTHILGTIVSFPSFTAPNDSSDLVLDPGQLKIAGCFANRYDVTAQDIPAPDVNVGTVTLSGYDTHRFTPTNAAATMFAPVPDTISCAIPGGAPFYACAYSGTGGANGFPTSATIFPPIPAQMGVSAPNSFVGFCALFGGGLMCMPADCDTTNTGGANAAFCEQTMFHAGTSKAKFVVPGNPTAFPHYPVANNAGLDVQTPVKIVSIKIGTVEIGVNKKLDDLDGKLAASPNQDVEIAWSCDGSDTPGGGCGTINSGLQLVALTAQTSLNPRTSFASPPSPKFGTLTCFQPASTGKMKVDKMHLANLLHAGDASINMNFIRLKLNPASITPTVGQGAGIGTFALIRP